MDKLEKINFDYSLLDTETSNTLQAKAYRINQLTSKTAYEIGKELKEAQDELSKKGYGIFTEWFESLGFKKTKAYQYINHYDFVRSESERSNIEMFETLPKSLQSEMSKPSADPELNQKVYDGDITTHKKYKEMERKLKQKVQEVEELKNKEPEVIEKEITKEVVPHDYDGLKSDNVQLEQVNRRLAKEIEILEESNKFVEKNYQDLLNQRADVDEKSKKYDQLTEEIEELAKQKNRQAQQVETIRDFERFKRNVNELLVKLSPIIYRDDIELLEESGITLSNYKDLVGKVQSWCDDMNRKLEEPKIIEGVYTDE